jgi:hypothetical protein
LRQNQSQSQFEQKNVQPSTREGEASGPSSSPKLAFKIVEHLADVLEGVYFSSTQFDLENVFAR